MKGFRRNGRPVLEELLEEMGLALQRHQLRSDAGRSSAESEQRLPVTGAIFF